MKLSRLTSLNETSTPILIFLIVCTGIVLEECVVLELGGLLHDREKLVHVDLAVLVLVEFVDHCLRLDTPSKSSLFPACRSMNAASTAYAPGAHRRRGFHPTPSLHASFSFQAPIPRQ